MFKNIFNILKSFLIKNYKTLIIIILSIFVLSLSISTCSNEKQLSLQEAQIVKLKLDSQRLDSIKNKYGEQIYVQEVEKTQDKEFIKKLTDSIFNLSKKNERQINSVIAYYQSRTSVRVDSFETAWVDTVKMKRFTDSVEKNCANVIKYYRDSTAQVGTTFRDSTKDFKFSATLLSPKSILINNIQLTDNEDIRVSELKGGLFKRNQQGKLKLFLKRSYRIEVKHSNPHFINTGMKSIIFVPPNKHPLIKGVIIGAVTTFVGLKFL